ncbi:MAG: hypothetical protein PHW11_05475 [Anaerolineaceae bacterium]|nr:hypothetical protein [Anaerolineaceae bacterium]MDD4042473.1 hypothetical protein [Anaerolineaceae bacterium]
MADTLNYFIAGYVVIFGLLAAYIGWLVARGRQVEKKLARKKEQEKASVL